MFVLALVKQTVRVPAEKFDRDVDQAISEELNLKFANKVVMDVGLCIALWDIVKRGESFILPGDSGHHTKVEFRYVVFRPFMDQILVGRIKNCDKSAVQVTLGFFDDIFISGQNLQNNSKFDEKEHTWVWEYESEDGKHELFMDTGEEIRFKVIEECFIDTTPSAPGSEAPDSSLDPIKDNKKMSYRIQASIKESGLGLLTWWMG
uniref:EOG090X0DHL n=1 Tax=Daphnia galeata TaxID=27404 RepID=A0A8J2WKP9_9CRUS|nr:unnamed protein product [Daphnia galeata]